MSVETFSPAANYLTRSNIIHPQSERGTAGDPYVAAAEADARLELQARKGVTSVTGGSIKKGR